MLDAKFQTLLYFFLHNCVIFAFSEFSIKVPDFSMVKGIFYKSSDFFMVKGIFYKLPDFSLTKANKHFYQAYRDFQNDWEPWE